MINLLIRINSKVLEDINSLSQNFRHSSQLGQKLQSKTLILKNSLY